jgi:hypothetical protein
MRKAFDPSNPPQQFIDEKLDVNVYRCVHRALRGPALRWRFLPFNACFSSIQCLFFFHSIHAFIPLDSCFIPLDSCFIPFNSCCRAPMVPFAALQIGPFDVVHVLAHAVIDLGTRCHRSCCDAAITLHGEVC